MKKLIAALGITLFALPAAAFAAFDVNLKQGDKGAAVIELQNFLITQGHLTAGNNTGNFGPLTLAAVKAFQSAKGISPASGFFGPMSRAVAASMAAGCAGCMPTSDKAVQIVALLKQVQELQALLEKLYAAQCMNVPPPAVTGGCATPNALHEPVKDARGCVTGWRCPATPTPTQNPAIKVSISPSTVSQGQAATITWNTTDAPIGAKVRLEVISIGEEPLEGNNGRGVGGVLPTSGSYKWTVPVENAPCMADSGDVSCLEKGQYRIVAKLYTGSECWGYCAFDAGRTVHTKAVSSNFSLVPADTSKPYCLLNAVPSVRAAGQTFTLTYTGANVAAASINQGIGVVQFPGTVNIAAQQYTTYTMAVTGPGGANPATCTASVVIQ